MEGIFWSVANVHKEHHQMCQDLLGGSWQGPRAKLGLKVQSQQSSILNSPELAFAGKLCL